MVCKSSKSTRETINTCDMRTKVQIGIIMSMPLFPCSRLLVDLSVRIKHRYYKIGSMQKEIKMMKVKDAQEDKN